MEAIEAVVALVKERDELSETLDEYEDWFEELVGKSVSIQLPSKKLKTKYVTAVITEFIPGEGWEAHGEDTDDVYEIKFIDFVKGEVWEIK